MPRLTLSLLCVLSLMLGFVSQTRAQFDLGGGQKADLVKARVVLNTDHLTPGQQGIAAVVVDIADGYHAQSSRPLDDTLIPFEVKTKPTPGVTFDKPLYPPGEVEDFPALGGKLSIYSHQVYAFVPFTVASDAKPGEAKIALSVGFQVCNDSTCEMPQTIQLTATTTIAAEAGKTINGEIFGTFDSSKWLNEHPLPTTNATTKPAEASHADFEPFTEEAFAAALKGNVPFIIDFTAAWCVNCHVVERRVYGDEATLAELAKRGVRLFKCDLTNDGAPGSSLLAKLNPSRSIPFTAVYFPGKEKPSGLTGIYSSADLIATLDDGGKTATSATSFFGYELSTAPIFVKMLAAIGVGLLLNAVPCVLPVLPLKAMSFYEDAGHSRSRSMLNGGAFSLGVIATFGALALFVISQDALWGKFISHPITAAVLTIVLLGAAAQAFGLFEFALPQSVTNLEAKVAAIGGDVGGPVLDYGVQPCTPGVGRVVVGNFFSGILIAVLSTPCTIGLFAAVIAVAISAGSTLGSIILMFVGVGMALPWFALSAFPEATRRFPRTGPWPLVVKQMTGFLLVATAIFFAVPMLPESIRGGPVWWSIFACVAASALFLLARTFQIAPRPRPIAIASTVALLLTVGGFGVTRLLGG